MPALYGLLGQHLGHSFSRTYFSRKFQDLGLDATYQNFEIPSIIDLPDLLAVHPDLRGFNVTIPYKTEILPYLHQVEETAAHVGAVNTVLVEEGRLLGFNTDVIGFRDSLSEFYQGAPGGDALVLGSGGASKAVLYVLAHYYAFDRVLLASRQPQAGMLSYTQLQQEGIGQYPLIVNCTPVGMYPDVHAELPLPWDTLRKGQHLFDLIYNPERSTFLEHGAGIGCRVQNGMDMLLRQADAAWEIWSEA